jgi:lipoprotein-anchoring transpeptidase ErfK/SrfK
VEDVLRRHVAGTVGALVSLAFLISAAPAPVTADTPTAVAAPTALSMATPGGAQSLPSGGWINTTSFEARFQVTASAGALTPQVEIESASTPFSGKPTSVGTPLTGAGAVTVTVSGLKNGRTYHWEARVVDGSGSSSAWVPFSISSRGFDLGVDQTPPTRPAITSPTNPDPNRWYNVQVPIVQWASDDALSGIRGYTFRLLRNPHVISGGAVTPATGAKLANLTDGTWWAAIRAIDRAGNWSPTATFRLLLDRRAPQIWWQSANHLQFNPFRGPIRLQFKVSKDASVRLALWRVGDRSPTATYSFPSVRSGQLVTIFWNGKTRYGKVVPKGYYYFAADVMDRANNFTHKNIGGINVSPESAIRTPAGVLVFPDAGKRIIVSLSQETLYAYDGTKLVLRTYVTTGNPSLPTPLGSYTILAKYSPFEFVSPWPAGSPYWYPPSWTTWAMLFQSEGYFLHDAPWRSAFGPGTNGPGQPGTNYGGTHGCVNIPPGPMQTLWNFSPTGTPVDIVP